MTTTFLLELNEVNFEFVQIYAALGKLPALAEAMARHGLTKTTSEICPTKWEPWIQWVTAHSGLTLDQHGIFRLGDIIGHEVDQIWEVLERKGIKVAALCPMNASNRAVAPAFFLPDPWTKTTVTAPFSAKVMFSGLTEFVNRNADSDAVPLSAILKLLLGTVSYAMPKNYGQYAKIAARSRNANWNRALFLDLLLTDTFISLVQSKHPQFASIFLNGAAHLQHHYMFSSRAYSGEERNPEWYIDPADDPILAIYELYDQFFARLKSAFPAARILIATGLHQVPHKNLTYYWRLKDHSKFLSLCGVPHVRVEPRMSRDFVVYCSSTDQALHAQRKLSSVKSTDQTPLFTTDNRGDSLFVELTFDRPIVPGFAWISGDTVCSNLEEHVAFVAIKNGEHDGLGYFLDTGLNAGSESTIPLSSLPNRIREIFEV
jgi:hypothetical protein